MKDESTIAHVIAERYYLRSGVIFLFCLSCYFSVWKLVGFIPFGVGDGVGFDGSIYLDYIIRLSRGESVQGDPYRLIRIVGFTPAVFYAAIFSVEDASSIVRFQAIFNAVTLSAIVTILSDLLIRLTEKPRMALLIVGSMFFSWAWLVMPVYYPLLSDHAALAISTASLWAWAVGRRILLGSIIFISTWIMPGLFIVPLVLLCLPFRRYQVEFQWRWSLWLALVILAIFFLWPIVNLTYQQILNHPIGMPRGWPEMKWMSLIFLCVEMLCVIIFWVRIIGERNLIYFSDWKSILVGMLTLFGSAIFIWAFFNWREGFVGPPLMEYLYLQSVSAPGKPAIAHFIYYGPLFLIAFIAGICSESFLKDSRSYPIFVLISICFPILFIGSESRQWLYFLPPMAVFVALNGVSLKVAALGVVFAVFSHVVYLFVRESNFYFSRQGPWMSIEDYLFGLLLLLSFFVIYLLINKSEKIK